jgi:hypothetical protein
VARVSWDGLCTGRGLAKNRKRRHKKKRFRNEMDDMEKGYGNDMYDLSDFDQIKK